MYINFCLLYTSLGNVPYAFYGWANYSQHTAHRVEARQIIHLYVAQSFCRSLIACQNDEVTTHLEQFGNCLQGELIDLSLIHI